MKTKPKLSRFDLLLPRAAIEIVSEEATIRGISPRVMGRMIFVEKVKEIRGIAPHDCLPTDVGEIPRQTSPAGGDEHDRTA